MKASWANSRSGMRTKSYPLTNRIFDGIALGKAGVQIEVRQRTVSGGESSRDDNRLHALRPHQVTEKGSGFAP